MPKALPGPDAAMQSPADLRASAMKDSLLLPEPLHEPSYGSAGPRAGKPLHASAAAGFALARRFVRSLAAAASASSCFCMYIIV